METISLIESVGFPVVACLAMAWFAKYTMDNHRADLNGLNEQHRKFELQMLEAINNNTHVMETLCDRLGEKEAMKDE